MRKTIAMLVIAGILAVGVAAILYSGRSDNNKQTSTPQTTETVAPPVATENDAEAAGAVDRTIDKQPAEPHQQPEEPVEAAALRVYGTVTDFNTGGAVQNALITLTEGNEGVSVYTDSAGSFDVDGSAGKALEVSCSAPGYAEAAETISANTGKEVRIDFVLRPGSGISGRVTEAASGQGVEGVVMHLAPARASLVERAQSFGKQTGAITDANGDYAIKGLEPGAYTISPMARSLGFLSVEKRQAVVNVAEGESRDKVDFLLERGGLVRGTVVSVNGAPVSGASLQVMPVDVLGTALDGLDGSVNVMELAPLAESSDDKGLFEIAGLDYDVSYRLSAQAEGFAASYSQDFLVERGEGPAEFNLVLSPGSTVSGIARYESGEPATDERIHLTPEMGAIMAGRVTDLQSATTDAQGAFEFANIPAGKYTASARDAMPFVLGGRRKAVELTVDGVHPVTGVEIIVAEGPAAEGGNDETISGKVVLPDGAPAPDTTVKAFMSPLAVSQWSVATDASGTFVLKDLRGNLFDLRATSEKGVGEVKGVRAGASDVVIRLMPPSFVSGIVVDAEGHAVPSCKVALNKTDDAKDGQSAADYLGAIGRMLGSGGTNIMTDINGFFEFAEVSPGSYTVEATSETKGKGTSRAFTIAAGVDTTGLRVQLEPGLAIAGAVRDGNGAPIEGAMVKLMASEGNAVSDMMTMVMPGGVEAAASATTAPDGTFRLDNVPVGTYSLLTTHSAYSRSVQRGFEVSPGRPLTNLRITLTEGGSTHGHFVVDGQPQSGIMVQLVGPSGLHMATTDSEGRFELSGIAPGTYLVNTIDMSRMLQDPFSMLAQTPRVVDIADGENPELDLGPGPGTTVTGAVSGPRGSITLAVLSLPGAPDAQSAPPMDFAAQIEAARYLVGQARVGEDGTFTIEGVEPGVYDLQITTLDIDLQNLDLDMLMQNPPPVVRQQIEVGTEPFSLDVTLPGTAGSP